MRASQAGASALEIIGHIRANGGFGPLGRGGGHPNGRARYFASVFASKRDPDALDEVLERYGAFDDMIDLCACWAQELVLHGVELGGPWIDELATWLVAREHPLARLPMHRLPLERDAPTQPQFSRFTGATDWSAGFEYWSYPRIEPELEVPSSVEGTVARDAEIAAVFESHCEVSNGKSEHRVYLLDPARPRPAGPALLASLAADCLQGSTPATTHAASITPPEAYALLLMFASVGGDYNRAHSGAYGRRDAWRSLAGLTGTTREAGLEAIEAAARASHWTWFQPLSTWFYNVVTDLAMACVSPRGDAVALLAGSDTD